MALEEDRPPAGQPFSALLRRRPDAARPGRHRSLFRVCPLNWSWNLLNASDGRAPCPRLALVFLTGFNAFRPAEAVLGEPTRSRRVPRGPSSTSPLVAISGEPRGRALPDAPWRRYAKFSQAAWLRPDAGRQMALGHAAAPAPVGGRPTRARHGAMIPPSLDQVRGYRPIGARKSTWPTSLRRRLNLFVFATVTAARLVPAAFSRLGPSFRTIPRRARSRLHRAAAGGFAPTALGREWQPPRPAWSTTPAGGGC